MKTAQLGFNLQPETQADDKKQKEPTVFSVSDINGMIRGTLEGQFQSIWLRGEISNFKPHTSGHFYFSLKDDRSQISAVMFRGHNSKLRFRPENGLEVLVKGKITVYEPRGNYQVFCEWMEPVGAGALQKAFEQLKAKLQSEGLFAAERKRALPAFPKHIGIVTSPTGAAIQDILNVLRRRYKAARVTLSPALVQGPPAADSIVKAIELINRVPDVDVLIVGRGGGSAEDLWCFNEEKVARAIAASRIPVISAVGHEVDFTIADFVADLRAPTPSAAAELVVKNATDLCTGVIQLRNQLNRCMQFKLRNAHEQLKSLRRQLIDPRRRLQDLIFRCDELTMRLEQSVFRYIADCRMRVEMALRKMGSPREHLLSLKSRLKAFETALAQSMKTRLQERKSALREAMAKMEALSPLKVVQRGYSIVTTGKKKIVKSVKQLKTGDEVHLQFAEGSAQASIIKLEKN